MLKGKVAIVTGSTSGIGLGIARELAKAGADLVLNGFGEASEIEAIRSGIERDHGVRVVYDGADMSKGDAVRGLIAATIEKFGRLDILVNNAGIQFTAPVDEFPAAKWDAILGDQSVGGVPRHRSGGAADEKAALGTDRQHRFRARPRRFDAQGRLRRGQARDGRPDQGGRPGDRRQRRHLQCGLSRLGANAAGGKADQRHRCATRHQPEGSRRRALVREAAVAGFCLAGAAWRHRRVPVLRLLQSRSRARRSRSMAAGLHGRQDDEHFLT